MMPYLRSVTWKQGLAVGAVTGLLVGAAILAYRTGIQCGKYLWGLFPVPYVILAGVILSVSAAVGVAALRLPEATARQVGQRLLITVSSVVLTLGIMDITVRLTDPPLVYTTPFYTEVDTLGYFYQPQSTHRFLLEDWRFAAFRTDAKGIIIRGASNDPRPNAHRIVFLGDSFTAAVQVMPEEAASVLVADKLAAAMGEEYQSLNLGVTGYSPIASYLAYQAMGEQFDPEIVVMMVFAGNDISDVAQQIAGSQVSFDANGDPVALQRGVNAAVTGFGDDTIYVDPVDHRARLVPRDVWHSGILRTLQYLVIRPACQLREFELNREKLEQRLVSLQSAKGHDYNAPCPWCDSLADVSLAENPNAIFKPEEFYTEQDRRSIRIFEDTILSMKDRVESQGRRFLLVILPVNHQIYRQGADGKVFRGLAQDEIITSTAPQDIINELCRRESIDCMDMLPVFRAHDTEAIYWIRDPHLSPHGQALLAESIAKHLLEKK